MSKDRSDDGDYEVGYKKPPKYTRYVKGQSGNPSGRPKKPKRSEADDIADAVKRALDRRHKITDNNRTRKMRKADILGEQIVNAALGKNLGMAKLAIDLERRAIEANKAEPEETFNEAESAIFDDLLKRLKEPEEDDGESSGGGT